MIKATGATNEGVPVALVGVTFKDIEDLKAGNGAHHLKVDLRDLGLDLVFMLLVDENEEALSAQFEKMQCPTMVN